jgi:hypothetical protein
MRKLALLCCTALALALVAPPARAVVTGTTTEVSYTGNGSTTVFSFPFKATDNAWVKVFLGGVAQSSGFTVTRNTNQDSSPGGSVTFTAAPGSGVAVKLQRVVPLTQELVLQAGTPFPPKSVTQTLDRLVMQTQQVDTRVAAAEATHAADKAAWQAGDSTLQANIDVEEADRVAGDLAAQGYAATLVSGEASTRASEDSSIRAQVASAALGGGVNIADTSTVLPTGGVLARALKDHLATVTPPSDAAPMKITKADGATSVGHISTSDTFAGYSGTALTGAPRLRLGTNAPMAAQPNGDADDSALLILRNLTGDSLFSHAIRDETTFNTATTGAYASFDSIPTFNGATHYNHLRSFQARPEYKGSGPLDEMNGIQYSPKHTGAGTVAASYGLHVADDLGTGPIQNQYAIYIDPLTRGASNVGIFVAGNDNYLLGKLVIQGALEGVSSFSMSGELKAGAFNAIGTPAAYNANGGLGVYGYESNSYAVVKAYSNGSGTEKTLALNPAGVGNVGVGTTTPQTTLDVNGGFRIASQPPANSGTACAAGTIAWDAGFVYVCTSTNAWKRAAIATW